MKITSLVIVPTLLFFGTSGYAVAQQRGELIADYPTTGVQLGNGWDSYASQKTPDRCVTGVKVTDPGTHRTVVFTESSDVASLMRAFSVSAQAKASSVGGGSISARASFSRSTTLSTTGLNIAVNAMVVQGADYLAPTGDLAAKLDAMLGESAIKRGALSFTPTDAGPVGATTAEGILAILSSVDLTPAAARLARRDPAAFRLQCGDGFVSMVHRGSGIQGVVSASTKNEKEHQEVSASITASFASASGQVDSNSTLDRMHNQSRLTINYTQMGGDGTPLATSPDEFRKLVAQVGTTATNDSAAPFEIGLMPYTRLPSYPRRDGSTLGDAEAMASQYYRLFSLNQYLSDVFTNPQSYVVEAPVSLPDLTQLQASIAGNMKKLSEGLRRCVASAQPCAFPDGVDRQDYGYRSRLPLTKANAADWAELQAASAALPAAEYTLAHTDRTRVSHRGGHPRRRHNIPNEHYAEALERVQQLQATIRQLADAYDNPEQRFRLMIALPARERCAQGEEDVCIDQPTIESFRSRMRSPQ